MRSLGVAVVVVVLLGLAASSGAATKAEPPWVVQRSADAAHVLDNQLSAATCTTTKWCAAVGSSTTTSLSNVALAEMWNGRTWGTETTAEPGTASQLSGVACLSSTSCMTVGQYSNGVNKTRSLAEWWNGRFWAALTPPSPARALSSQLDAVSCFSSAACMAVGSYDDHAGATLTLSEWWNGRTWMVERPQQPADTIVSDLTGVSCVGPKSCMAVGSYNNGHANGMANATPLTLAEQWNGRSWVTLTTPDPTPAGELTHAKNRELFGVSCTSTKACTAVGTFQENLGVGGSTHDGPVDTLVDRWNGKVWVVQRTPSPTGSSRVLQAVDCTSATVCTAIGNYKTSKGTNLFMERWTGKAWALKLITTPGPARFPELNGLGCSRTTCTAVGSYSPTSRVVTLVERSGA